MRFLWNIRQTSLLRVVKYTFRDLGYTFHVVKQLFHDVK